MSRPNRGFVPRSQQFSSFDNSGSDHRSSDAPAAGNPGAPHGHGPTGYGVPPTYGSHSTAIGGPFLPPQRENPQTQHRNDRGLRVSPDQIHGTEDYNFSGVHQVPHIANYQADPGYPGYVHGAQPSHPQDYYRTRDAGGQWNSPELGFQGQQHMHSMGQDVLGGGPGLSRRGMRGDAPMSQSQVQPFQSGSSQPPPGGFYEYRSSPGSAPFLGQSPYTSPSPSSSEGSPVDSGNTTLSISPREIQDSLPVEDYLRQEALLLPNQPVSLWSIPDPHPGIRPTLTLKLLASLAIFGSRDQRLTLQEIYEHIENRFAWYKNEPSKKWQGSLRHNLSLECIFLHIRRPVAEPGKGGYWTLTNKDGYGQKRMRKRNPKGGKDSRIKTEEEDELLEDDEDDSPYDPQVGPSSGVQRTMGSSRSYYSPAPQHMPSYPGHRMTNSPVHFDSGVVFGQPSFPTQAPGHFRQPSQPVRTQSLPHSGGQVGAYQPPNRPATVPVVGMRGSHPMTGAGERRRRHTNEDIQYPSQNDMDVDEDSGRAGAFRRSGKGKRRAD